jgi:hypothetical protein
VADVTETIQVIPRWDLIHAGARPPLRRVAQADDELTLLLPGADLLSADLLADGIHPGDEGHRKLATRIGLEVHRLRDACRSGRE